MARGSSLKQLFLRWKESQSGNIAVIAAITMPVVIGFVGLGVETGFWFYKQRVLQGAADITSYNAVVALRNTDTVPSIRSQASTDAAANGWTAGIGTITVNTPPTTGPNQNVNSVEVILTESETRMFSKIFISTPMNIRVRSVATYASNGNACLLALNKTAPQAVRLWGSNVTNLNGCNIMSDSFANDAVAIGGSSTVTAPCVLAVGSVSVSSTLNLTSCASPTNNAAPAKDPYGTLPAPAAVAAGPCKIVPGGNAQSQT